MDTSAVPTFIPYGRPWSDDEDFTAPALYLGLSLRFWLRITSSVGVGVLGLLIWLGIVELAPGDGTIADARASERAAWEVVCRYVSDRFS